MFFQLGNIIFMAIKLKDFWFIQKKLLLLCGLYRAGCHESVSADMSEGHSTVLFELRVTWTLQYRNGQDCSLCRLYSTSYNGIVFILSSYRQLSWNLSHLQYSRSQGCPPLLQLIVYQQLSSLTARGKFLSKSYMKIIRKLGKKRESGPEANLHQ